MIRGRRSKPHGERGAAMVEYALIIVLVVIASMGAISAATDSGESHIAGSDDRISPDDQSYYAVWSAPPRCRPRPRPPAGAPCLSTWRRRRS